MSEQSAAFERLRKIIELRVVSYLWVKGDTPPFRPALLPKVYGDGASLFTLSTINQRPMYYVIQGDSSWRLSGDDGDGPYFAELSDDILTDLEGHFGNARCGYSGNNLYFPKRERVLSCKCEECTDGKFRARWPMVDGQGGCSWGRMAWPSGTTPATAGEFLA